MPLPHAAYERQQLKTYACCVYDTRPQLFNGPTATAAILQSVVTLKLASWMCEGRCLALARC